MRSNNNNMVDCTDEKILNIREEERKKQFNTLDTGIYLGGKILKFEQQVFMNAFSISLPENMGGMPMEYAKVKYPSEFRPQIILTTPELDVNLGFTLFPEESGKEDLESIAERIMRVIKRVHPDYRIYPVKNLGKKEGAYFSFRSHALDSDLYNMSLVMKIKGRLLQGSFNCAYQKHSEWRNIVLMMWNTIQEWKEDEECALKE